MSETLLGWLGSCVVCERQKVSLDGRCKGDSRSEGLLQSIGEPE